MAVGRPAHARSSLQAIAVVLAAMLSACGQDNRYRRAAAAEGDGRAAPSSKRSRAISRRPATPRRSTPPISWRGCRASCSRSTISDGDLVKEGATLFTIEPEPYQLKLEQAQAAEAAAQATLKQAEAEYERQAELVEPPSRNEGGARQRHRQPRLRAGQARSRRRPTPPRPQLNLDYTQVKAPFDGIRHGAAGLDRRTGRRQRPDPARHHRPARSDLRELQHQRAGRAARARGGQRGSASATRSSRKCRSRSGCKTTRDIRTKARSTTPRRRSTWRPARSRRAPFFQNANRCCCRAISCACACREEEQNALLVPEVALGSDQGGRYVLVVNKDNVVEQRKVTIGPMVGELRVIETRTEARGSRRRRRHPARHSRREGRSADAGRRRDAGRALARK